MVLKMDDTKYTLDDTVSWDMVLKVTAAWKLSSWASTVNWAS